MLTKDLLLVSTRRACVALTSTVACRAASTPSSSHLTKQLPTHSKCRWHIRPVMSANSNVIFQTRRCKGHAHWQNVAHIKKEKNAERAAIRAPLYIKMREALRSGGPDPKQNRKLEKVIQECSVANVPKTYVQGWIKSYVESKSKGPTFVELNGPRGIVFVVKIAFDTVEVRNNINQKAKKVNVKATKTNRWNTLFDQRGVIIVPVSKDMDVTNMDKYIEIAIESGAEDVIVTKNDEQVPDVENILKFHCDPVMVDQVGQEIQDTFELSVFSQEVELIPHSYIPLETEEEADFCQAVHDKMYSIEEVEKVYDNTTLSAAD